MIIPNCLQINCYAHLDVRMPFWRCRIFVWRRKKSEHSSKDRQGVSSEWSMQLRQLLLFKQQIFGKTTRWSKAAVLNLWVMTPKGHQQLFRVIRSNCASLSTALCYVQSFIEMNLFSLLQFFFFRCPNQPMNHQPQRLQYLLWIAQRTDLFTKMLWESLQRNVWHIGERQASSGWMPGDDM